MKSLLDNFVLSHSIKYHQHANDSTFTLFSQTPDSYIQVGYLISIYDVWKRFQNQTCSKLSIWNFTPFKLIDLAISVDGKSILITWTYILGLLYFFFSFSHPISNPSGYLLGFIIKIYPESSTFYFTTSLVWATVISHLDHCNQILRSLLAFTFAPWWSFSGSSILKSDHMIPLFNTLQGLSVFFRVMVHTTTTNS